MYYRFQNRNISKDQFQELLDTASATQKIETPVLEKDYWICAALDELFKHTPNMHTFKGI